MTLLPVHQVAKMDMDARSHHILEVDLLVH